VFGEIMWSEDSEAHIARHGVTPDEVEEGLYTRPRRIDDGRNETTLVWCTTTSGRHLLVVVAEAPDGRDFIVTARDMDDDEKKRFQRTAR
jgi:uncharacterized protein